MELALLALGVGSGDEVLCPSFTFASTANAILRVGARPVLVDIEATYLGIDPDAAERRSGPRTAAIMPVHYGGLAAEMDALLEIAQRRGLKMVEDAAQSFGATFRGRPLGTLGDAGCLSFHETKNLTCGEGGALLLRDPATSARAEIIREKGTNRKAFLRGEVDKYTWVSEGSSYVLSDILAAVLDAQLDKREQIVARRAEVAARYRDALADWARGHGVGLPAESPERASNHHIFYVLLPDVHARDRCLAFLRARGVMAAFHYVPLHASPFGRAFAEGQYPVTELAASTLIRLPIHPQLAGEDVERVIDAVLASPL
jgi:dTDP-4-amino-4,6-dideoxygalactose transaminase